MSDNERKKIQRRDLLQKLMVVGAGTATLVGFQNCSPVGFRAKKREVTEQLSQEPTTAPDVFDTEQFSCRVPGLIPDYPFYHDPNKINDNPVYSQANPGNLASVASEHRISVGYHRENFLNPDSGQVEAQSFLTVDVGSSSNSPHPVGNSNFNNNNTLADIYVFEKIADNYQLIFWKRFGASDFRASSFFLLDQATVNRSSQLKIIARCTLHGYWSEDFSLGQAPSSYSSAVPSHNSSSPFGGTDLFRPYIALGANGGQSGLNSTQHSPAINVVDNNTVEVYMGSSGARHPALDNSNYIAGAYLFDQNGHQLAPQQVLNINRANGSHVFRFTGLNLSGRGVKILRSVCQDTFNGHFMGFKQV